MKNLIARICGKDKKPANIDINGRHPQAFLFYRGVESAYRERPDMLVAVRGKRTESGAVLPFGNGVYRLTPAEYRALQAEGSDIVSDWRWMPAESWLAVYHRVAKEVTYAAV